MPNREPGRPTGGGGAQVRTRQSGTFASPSRAPAALAAAWCGAFAACHPAEEVALDWPEAADRAGLIVVRDADGAVVDRVAVAPYDGRAPITVRDDAGTRTLLLAFGPEVPLGTVLRSPGDAEARLPAPRAAWDLNAAEPVDPTRVPALRAPCPDEPPPLPNLGRIECAGLPCSGRPIRVDRCGWRAELNCGSADARVLLGAGDHPHALVDAGGRHRCTTEGGIARCGADLCRVWLEDPGQPGRLAGRWGVTSPSPPEYTQQFPSSGPAFAPKIREWKGGRFLESVEWNEHLLIQWTTGNAHGHELCPAPLDDGVETFLSLRRNGPPFSEMALRSLGACGARVAVDSKTDTLWALGPTDSNETTWRVLHLDSSLEALQVPWTFELPGRSKASRQLAVVGPYLVALANPADEPELWVIDVTTSSVAVLPFDDDAHTLGPPSNDVGPLELTAGPLLRSFVQSSSRILQADLRPLLDGVPPREGVVREVPGSWFELATTPLVDGVYEPGGQAGRRFMSQLAMLYQRPPLNEGGRPQSAPEPLREIEPQTVTTAVAEVGGHLYAFATNLLTRKAFVTRVELDPLRRTSGPLDLGSRFVSDVFASDQGLVLLDRVEGEILYLELDSR